MAPAIGPFRRVARQLLRVVTFNGLEVEHCLRDTPHQRRTPSSTTLKSTGGGLRMIPRALTEGGLKYLRCNGLGWGALGGRAQHTAKKY